MAAGCLARVLPVSSTAQDARMPDQPEKLATIECATCGALIEVFRRDTPDGTTIDWRQHDADLCKQPHRCPQARLEVRRRFPHDEIS